MRNFRSSASLVLAAFALACGDDTPTDTAEPLPKAPQIFFSSAFLVFPRTIEGQTSKGQLVFNNGGKDDLVISQIRATGSGATSFTPDKTGPVTIESREAAAVEVSFKPTGRGMRVAQLEVTSNAENFPTLALELVGPGISAADEQGAAVPDLAAFESPVAIKASGDSGIGFVRLYNLGRDSAIITGYDIVDDAGSLFAFPTGTVKPGVACGVANPCAEGLFCSSAAGSVCAVSLPSAQSVVLTVVFTPGAATSATAKVRVTSNDPNEPQLDIALAGTK